MLEGAELLEDNATIVFWVGGFAGVRTTVFASAEEPVFGGRLPAGSKAPGVVVGGRA